MWVIKDLKTICYAQDVISLVIMQIEKILPVNFPIFHRVYGLADAIFKHLISNQDHKKLCNEEQPFLKLPDEYSCKNTYECRHWALEHNTWHLNTDTKKLTIQAPINTWIKQHSEHFAD